MTLFTGTIPTIASGDTTTVPANLATYRDALKALSEAWTTFTPTWTATTTNPVLNNGTITGHYAQINKTVLFWIKLTVGSTTTVGSGIYQLTLPVATVTNHPGIFDISYLDSSAGATYRGLTQLATASKANLLYDSSSAGGIMVAFTAVAPVVPATGDVYSVTGIYETA